jgi:hypothetical protein
MGEIVTGDNTKGIKGVGELALRISRFDSYRLFTLYENVKERKVMNVSGNQKYYLVFKSPKKEIRIPEYEPNGWFEVDKANGCILFKITKKNAEDILSMKTAGEKIFYIIRVFEERDAFGKVLNITDEVEVYNGKWGDDEEFSSFSTENKIDLLTKALASQIDKNANVLKDYNELLEKHNDISNENIELQAEISTLRSQMEELQSILNEYTGNTYDGTLLSTDTKYIALTNTMENISLTEDELKNAISSALEKDDNTDIEPDTSVDGEPFVLLNINKLPNIKNLNITVYKNSKELYKVKPNIGYEQYTYINDGDVFTFECSGLPIIGQDQTPMKMNVEFHPSSLNSTIKDIVDIKTEHTDFNYYVIKATVNYNGGSDSDAEVDAVGYIGTFLCEIVYG